MKHRIAILLAVLGLFVAVAPVMAERIPDIFETELKPLQVNPGHLVALVVDPASGNILLPPPGRDTINDSFTLVSATCVDCVGQPGGNCPPTTKTVRVVLRALVAVPAGWNVSDLTLAMTTLVDVDYSESTKDPSDALDADDLVTVDINTSVSSCDHWFKTFFDMCDVAPAQPTDPCPAGGCPPITPNSSQVFDYVGAVEQFVVPAGITAVRIQASGAQGGGASVVPGTPGKGARVQGDFSVSPGQVLNVLVGEQPPPVNYAGGGGGGSFVWVDATDVLLVAAGGGGGACYLGGSSDGHGVDATVTADGTHGRNRGEGGGTAGSGGAAPTVVNRFAGGGAGWLSDGNPGSDNSGPCTDAGGGQRPLAGGAGGAAGGNVASAGRGGFGGGGGAQGRCDVVGAGGGGGFSGGGPGYEVPDFGSNYGGGGGGGSFNAGCNQTSNAGAQTGHGQVTISWQS